MDRTLNVSVIYGIVACLSLVLAGGYCATIKKKENGSQKKFILTQTIITVNAL